jgi:hypothetical protein
LFRANENIKNNLYNTISKKEEEKEKMHSEIKDIERYI